jgi:hypothetical protein
VVAAVSEANMPAVAAAALITALATGLGSVPLAFATSVSPAAGCFGWLLRKWSQMRFVRRAGENK